MEFLLLSDPIVELGEGTHWLGGQEIFALESWAPGMKHYLA